MRPTAAFFAFGAAIATLPGMALASPASGLRSGAVAISPVDRIDYRRDIEYITMSFAVTAG